MKRVIRIQSIGFTRAAAALALAAAAWLATPAEAATYEFLGWELNPYIGGAFGRSTSSGGCGQDGVAEDGPQEFGKGRSRFSRTPVTLSAAYNLVDCEGSNTGFKIYGGLRVHEYLALELGYVSLGEHSRGLMGSANDGATLTLEGSGDVMVAHDGGWAGSFVGMLPVARIVPRTILPAGEVIALGRLGMHSWKVVVNEQQVGYQPPGTPPEANPEYMGPLAHLGEDDGFDLYFGIGGEYLLDNGVGLRLEWERYLFDGAWHKADVDLFSLGAVYRF